MRREYRGRGVILYEKERCDYEQEALLALAKNMVGNLGDGEAAAFGALFPQWQAGVPYIAGARVSDEQGHLYRVVQAHTSQADWPLEGTPALYTPLGVTAEDPEAAPQWRQPQGAHDAYRQGDRVIYQDKTWESTMDGNVWAPGVAGWSEVTA